MASSRAQLLRQLQAEGVGTIVLVTDGSDRPWRVADIPTASRSATGTSWT
jgi:hypothetical protein